MKNRELKELIENKAKQLKEKLFEVYDVYADDNSDATVLISIPCGKSEYSFHVLESDLTWWKKTAPSTLYDVDCYMDNMSKEEKIKLLKDIEKTYDFLLSLQYEMSKLKEKGKDAFEKETNQKRK